MEDQIRSMQALYDESALPVVLYDPEWNVLWSNAYAKEHTPLLLNPEYLREMYLAKDEEKIRASLAQGDSLHVIRQRFFGENMVMTLTPILREGVFMGAAAQFLPQVSQPGRDGVYYGADNTEQVVDLMVSRLRNPLADLFALIDPLARNVERWAAGGTSLQYINGITRHAYKLLSNIINLSEYSRYQGGVTSLRLTQQDLMTHMRELCSASELFMMGFGLRLEFSCEEEMLFVCADFDRLDVAFLNLLCNACVHSKRGDVIHLSLTKKGENALITLTDSGCGMDPRQLEGVFVPLCFDEEESRFSGNMGMGLHVVRGILQLHGGTVAISSAVGQGTSVSLSLPLQQHKLPFAESMELYTAPMYLKDRLSKVYIFLSGITPPSEE